MWTIDVDRVSRIYDNVYVCFYICGTGVLLAVIYNNISTKLLSHSMFKTHRSISTALKISAYSLYLGMSEAARAA